ncbi:hypothetical protein SLEP1_g58154, partial [Rubroshorea leprosula]
TGFCSFFVKFLF